MMNRWRLRIFFDVLVVSVLLNATSRAEDFSVDLKRLVELDAARPLPEYKLESVVRQEDNRDADMPSKSVDVFIRFTEFGSVRLDGSGLANLMDVKVAWIKNSPDLFIVAWAIEDDPLGSSRDQRHGFVIMQLSDRRAAVLLRGRNTINAKIRNWIQDGVVDSSHFSFDAKAGVLREQMLRNYEEWQKDSGRHALARPQKDEEGNVIFVAQINETIILDYKLADGRLQPWKGSLVYHAREQDELGQIAHFYLGPYAPPSVLLEANADLAKKYKGSPKGEFSKLDQEQNRCWTLRRDEIAGPRKNGCCGNEYQQGRDRILGAQNPS
jgi:hypothetical protein